MKNFNIKKQEEKRPKLILRQEREYRDLFTKVKKINL